MMHCTMNCKIILLSSVFKVGLKMFSLKSETFKLNPLNSKYILKSVNPQTLMFVGIYINFNCNIAYKVKKKLAAHLLEHLLGCAEKQLMQVFFFFLPLVCKFIVI